MALITTADLNKIKENIIFAMKQNFKNDASLFPVAIIIDPNGGMIHFATPYTNQQEKNLMMGAVRAICEKNDAIAIFLITEAWIRKIKQEDYQNFIKEMKDTGKHISDFADKKEVALLVFETKLTGETTTFEMDRINNELINKTSALTSGGDFANILSPAFQNN